MIYVTIQYILNQFLTILHKNICTLNLNDILKKHKDFIFKLFARLEDEVRFEKNVFNLYIYQLQLSTLLQIKKTKNQFEYFCTTIMRSLILERHQVTHECMMFLFCLYAM